MNEIPSETNEFHQERQYMPKLADRVDFTDGANNCVELALLPSVDLIIGQLIAEPIQMGCKIRVEGRVLTDGDARQICLIEYELTPNLNERTIQTRGCYYTDPSKKKGTFIDEKTSVDCSGESMFVEGRLSTHLEGSRTESLLMISSGAENVTLEGTINRFPVWGRIDYDLAGNIKHCGKLGDVEFERFLIQDEESGTGRISGKFGDLQEEGEAIVQSDGSILIDRNIGPYHVIQKVVAEI